MTGEQAQSDPWEELATIKVILLAVVTFLPGALVVWSTTAATWCLEHGLLVAADQAVVRVPKVDPAVGLDIPRLVILVIGVVVLALSTIQYAVSVRRTRLRRALRDANRL